MASIFVVVFTEVPVSGLFSTLTRAQDYARRMLPGRTLHWAVGDDTDAMRVTTWFAYDEDGDDVDCLTIERYPVPYEDPAPLPRCERCGCTEDRGCPDFCDWDRDFEAMGRYVCDSRELQPSCVEFMRAKEAAHA